MKKAFKIIAVILVVALLVTGGIFYVKSRPFTPKIKHINSVAIPYESMKTEAFFEDYLKPLMLEIGFQEDEIICDKMILKKEKALFEDASLYQNHAQASYRFKIPNSRYYVAFKTSISWLTKGDYKHPGYLPNFNGFSAYIVQMYLTDEENTRRIVFKEIFSKTKYFPYPETTSGTYLGEDPTTVIFEEEHTTQELYENIVSFFAEDEIKETLYLEQKVK